MSLPVCILDRPSWSQQVCWAFALHLIPQEWLTGFLGLIPLAIGIKVALSKEETEEGEAEEIVEKLEARKSTQLFWTIALITIASGGDNLGSTSLILPP
jgi:cadmium resistance protein CadD (predicted permease)